MISIWPSVKSSYLLVISNVWTNKNEVCIILSSYLNLLFSFGISKLERVFCHPHRWLNYNLVLHCTIFIWGDIIIFPSTFLIEFILTCELRFEIWKLSRRFSIYRLFIYLNILDKHYWSLFTNHMSYRTMQ